MRKVPDSIGGKNPTIATIGKLGHADLAEIAEDRGFLAYQGYSDCNDELVCGVYGKQTKMDNGQLLVF